MEDKIIIEKESQFKEADGRLKKISQVLQKHFFLFFLSFLILISFAVVSVMGKTVQLRQKATGLVTPAFYFNPSSLVVVPGQQFQVEVKINTGGQLISVAAFQISYNSQVLQLTQITSGTLFPNVLRNQINNTIGKANLDAGVALTNPSYFSGDGVFAQLRFQVNTQAPASSQSIAFLLPNPANPKSLGDCDLIGSGTNTGLDLLASVSNLTVNVNPPPVSPTPTLLPPTATPPPISECKQKGGVCCLGGSGNCIGSLIYFWLNNQITTSGGCNPAKAIDGASCCQSCRYPVPVTATPTLSPTTVPPTITSAPSTIPTATRVPSTPTPTSTQTYCQQIGRVCCIPKKCNLQKLWYGDTGYSTQGGCSPLGAPYSALCCDRCL